MCWLAQCPLLRPPQQVRRQQQQLLLQRQCSRARQQQHVLRQCSSIGRRLPLQQTLVGQQGCPC